MTSDPKIVRSLAQSTSAPKPGWDEWLASDGGRSVVGVAEIAPEEVLRQTDTRWLDISKIGHLGESITIEECEGLMTGLHGIGYRIVICAHSREKGVELGLGAARPTSSASVLGAEDACRVMEKLLFAHFPSSTATRRYWAELLPLLSSMGSFSHIGAVIGLPSLRRDSSPLAALQEVLLAIPDREFAVAVVADPLSEGALRDEFQGTQRLLGSALGAGRREEHRTRQVREAAVSRQEQTTERQQVSEERESREHAERSEQVKQNAGVFGPEMTVKGVRVTLGQLSKTNQESKGEMWSLGRSLAHVRADREVNARAKEDHHEESVAVTHRQEFVDVDAALAAELLKVEQQRLLYAMSVGAWQASIYVVARDQATLCTAGNVLRAALSGAGSSQRPVRFVEFAREDAEAARSRLGQLQPLRLVDAKQTNALTTLMHSGELALTVAFPSRSVPGLEVERAVAFGQRTPACRKDARTIPLGVVTSFGRELADHAVQVDADDLTMHALICGTTGSGKTTTTLAMLTHLWCEHGIPFMVVDPKEEYRHELLRAIPGLRVLGADAPDWRLNPLRPPPGRSVSLYAEQLRNLLCASFDTEAAMPELILQALHECYRRRGWDLRTDRFSGPGVPLYPTLTDLQNEIPKTVARNGFEGILQSNYRAAIGARIRSLRQGWKGQILDGASNTGLEGFLSDPVVLDIGQMDPSGRAFLMGLVILQLAGLRRAQGTSRGTLRHLLVLEEAHQLVRNPQSLGGAMSPGRVHGLEAILDAIAELRAFGQGILVADQSPQELHPGILRSTSLKVVHRLVEGQDQKAAGDALGLDPLQTAQLGKLGRGWAVVRALGWEAPVVVKVQHRPRGA